MSIKAVNDIMKFMEAERILLNGSKGWLFPMDKKILLHVENRLLKGLLIKSIASANMGLLDIIDGEDLNLKLEAFGPSIALALLEITDSNINTIKEEINRLKEVSPHIPLMAIVSVDTSDIVTFAIRSGIKDVMFLSKNRESYRKVIEEKLRPYYEQWAPQPKPPHIVLSDLIQNIDIQEHLALELKHANRGNYPITLIMAYLSGEESLKAPDFFKRVKSSLRDTDKLLKLDDKNILGVFPYTRKEDALVLEQKFRKAFEAEFGKPGHSIRLYLYSLSYPIDGETGEMLLERLKDGISNSITLNSIKAPLNTLSKNELESYKQKIRQYRRFM